MVRGRMTAMPIEALAKALTATATSVASSVWWPRRTTAKGHRLVERKIHRIHTRSLQ